MMTNYKLEGDLEGRFCGLIEVLFRHLPGGTEKNHEIQSRCPVPNPIFEVTPPE
jgi:hypothetical protein